MEKPATVSASATENLDAVIAPDAPDAIETIENDTLVTATGGYWVGAYAYGPAWGPAFRPVYAGPAWGPAPYAAYAWAPRPHWWR